MTKLEGKVESEVEVPKEAETQVKWQKQPFYPIADFSHSDDPLLQAQNDYK